MRRALAFCYLDELKWNAELEKVPAALRAKHITRLDNDLAQGYGVTHVQSDPGWTQVRFTDAARFFAFLDAAHVCAVDLEPGDIPVLLGRGFDGLVLKRALERGLSLGRLEPTEIMETVREAAWQLQATPEEPVPGDTYYEMAVDDLEKAGLINKRQRNEAINTVRDPLAPKEAYSDGGIYSGGVPRNLPPEFQDDAPSQFDPFL